MAASVPRQLHSSEQQLNPAEY